MSELYELPEGWKIEKFDEIKISNVIGLVKSVKEQSPTLQYQYVKMNNITNDNRFSFDKIINVNATDEEVKKFNLKKGDFLFNTRNSAELVGKSCIFDYDIENVLYNNNIMRVRFRGDILSYFIAYQFGSRFIKNQLDNIKSATTNVAAIYYKTLKEINVLIPPFQEQKRIVTKLDTLFEKIDKAIALHQKNMDEADVFMGSVLNEVFGELEEKYGLTVLSTVVKINSGIALPKIFKDKEYSDGELEFFKVAQMNNDTRVMKGANLNFTLSQSKEFKIKLFPKGSILIPKRGGAILTNKKRIMEREASYDSNIMGLKADNKILLDEFLFIFLQSIDLSDYIDTTTIPQVNNKHIDMMNIPIAPLKIQEKVVVYIDEISQKTEKLKAIQKEKMQSLIALKASILDQAFRGEL